MSPTNKPSQSTRPVRQPVLLGLFTGTAVGAGYLLSGVPNVELMTLLIALCGGALGPWPGWLAGVLAAVIYSLGSPFGLPLPLLLASQALGLGAAGLWGGLAGNRVVACRLKGQRAAAVKWAVVIGAGSTLIYDILTNLAIIGALKLEPWVVLAGAVPYAALHVGSNILVFGALLPLLLPRVAGLKRSALVGRTGTGLLLIVALSVAPGVSLAQDGSGDSPARRGPGHLRSAPARNDSLPAPAAPDSARLAAPAADRVGTGGESAPPNGWQRPLWEPFAQGMGQWLNWRTDRQVITDGGLGAPSLVLGEAQTAWNPLFVRDGIPLGTGHILADDLWLVPTAGLRVASVGHGSDGWGGTGGVVALVTDDYDPAKAISSYQGVRGRHETYFRSVNLLTPRAAWRAAFEFEESLDKEGYNYTDLSAEDFAALSASEFPGHSRIRQSRARLFRELAPDRRLSVEFTNGRLTKDALPAYDAEHLELWDDGLAATMETGGSVWDLETAFFWRNRDVIWGDRAVDAVIGTGLRKLETGREGFSLDLRRKAMGPVSPFGLSVRATNWRIYDSLTDATWLTGLDGTGNGRGQTARAEIDLARVVGPTVWRVALGGDWQSEVGAAPAGEVAVASEGGKPLWQASVGYGGRAPRSDELLTPLRRDVAGRQLVLLPNPQLQREKTARAAAKLQFGFRGLDFALSGSMTRLRDGIAWSALPAQNERGHWTNSLAMDSRRVTGSIARQGKFLGWGRVLVEGTWQKADEKAGRASYLPPERYVRGQLSWEHHFFAEDGILQMALFSTRQGAMADPWDVTRSAQLPARTVHDLLVGFRLVGTHISILYRNLTGDRVQMTSGALSEGQGLDLRLNWAWVY